jgi:iron complex outermembrane receptor protein
MAKYLSILAGVLLSMNALAQTATIKGTVNTSDGKPAEAVIVAIKGVSKGTTTNAQGEYVIKSLQEGTYIIFTSSFGLEKKEQEVSIKAGETATVDFTLAENVQQLSEVLVLGQRESKIYNGGSYVVGKLPLKDIENPQVYNAVPKELLKEQVVTTFNDALKNATGITRLWESTGRGGDGAEYFSMRGFAVQPTMVNGLPSINNGALDPANIESIEVIKGPSGTLFGSPMISYGGLINVTTKKPYERFGGSFSYVAGSYNLNRIAADVNAPLSDRAFVRLNAAFNEQNSFQDAGFRKSYYVAPSFMFKASEKLTFLVNTEFLESEAANAPMIFLNRFVPIAFEEISLFEKNYENSFTSNDLSIRNPTFSLQAQAIYELSDSWTSQTVISRSTAKTNGYYHYLWDFGDGDTFGRYISKRNGETQSTDVQQNFIGDFKLGSMRNRAVVGVDYFQSNILNSSTGWVGNGLVTLSDGSDTGDLTSIGVDSLLVGSSEGVSSARSEVMSAYVSNVLNLTPSLSAMASVRVDNFKGRTAYWVTDEVESQTALSSKFGLVYQPIKDKLSLFGNYMNGFRNVAPAQVADADGSNARMAVFEPEQANQYEFGVKANLYKEFISVTASYYNILVSNKLMSDPNNVNNTIQGGEVESKGFEISAIANPVKGFNVVAGYSKNMAEVVADNPENGYLGLRPEEAGPSQLINFWLSYTLPTTQLKGLGVGFGGNAASEHIALNRNVTGSFTLPAYQVFNASLSYNKPNYSLILKANNLLNQKYYSGWSGVIPQQLRTISANLNYSF